MKNTSSLNARQGVFLQVKLNNRQRNDHNFASLPLLQKNKTCLEKTKKGELLRVKTAVICALFCFYLLFNCFQLEVMICVVVATKKKRQTCRLQKTSKCKETLKKKWRKIPCLAWVIKTGSVGGF